MRIDQKFVAGYVIQVARDATKNLRPERRGIVYQDRVKSGLKLWSDLSRTLAPKEAFIWLQRRMGNGMTIRPEKRAEITRKNGLEFGPETWAKSTRFAYRDLLAKLSELSGGKSAGNKAKIRANLVAKAAEFAAVKPALYSEERHGKYITRMELDSMLSKCDEIIAQFG